uniref:G-patch domain-containing protein n=1 Tax=Cyprinus carpio TaxID=7962 RepID=A0A8C1JIX0_CYPCA
MVHCFSPNLDFYFFVFPFFLFPDKDQLLEIAKANAAAMCTKAGVPIPESLRPKAFLQLPFIEEAKKKVTKQANSFNIKELTERCKKITENKEEMAIAKPHVSDDEEDERLFGASLKENKGITFSLSNTSIKPSVQTEATFAKEFLVFPGSQHKNKEADGGYGEWLPVKKKTNKEADGGYGEWLPPVDITLAVSERAVAQKKLAENSSDINAMCILNRAQEQVDALAQSNTIPGLCTGSAGAQVLSSDELSNSGPQAWIKKDQFLRAAPMGWHSGEGLGKHREGTVEPIIIDFKTDRKGKKRLCRKIIESYYNDHSARCFCTYRACSRRRKNPEIWQHCRDEGSSRWVFGTSFLENHVQM